MTNATTLFARALDPRAPMPDDATSEKILDAALELAVLSGLRHLTVEDVAQRAGVGRITVYRRFTDKQGLLDALMVRELRKNLTSLRASVDVALEPEEQIVEGFVAALRIAREHPLLVRIFRHEREDALNVVGTPEVFALLRAFMAAQLRGDRRRKKTKGGADVELVAELVVRLGLSFLFLPDSIVPLDDEKAVRKLARNAIAPMLAPREG
ncbi:MAG: TetR/AcrR family transcriptional regulator [Polyangiales bacterium]